VAALAVSGHLEDERAFGRESGQAFKGFGAIKIFELQPVTAGEFGKPHWVVAVPAAQRGRGREGRSPSIRTCSAHRQSYRECPLDEDPCAKDRQRAAVNAFNADHRPAPSLRAGRLRMTDDG
jgi:hypothetical protein